MDRLATVTRRKEHFASRYLNFEIMIELVSSPYRMEGRTTNPSLHFHCLLIVFPPNSPPCLSTKRWSFLNQKALATHVAVPIFCNDRYVVAVAMTFSTRTSTCFKE
jgi:hypothetical protein